MRDRLKTVATIGLIIAAFIVLCGLGTWQVLRLQQGHRDDAYRASRVNADPVQWTSKSTLTADDMNYRRVVISGHWDNAHMFVLSNRAMWDTLGKDAVTPLIPDDGGPAILVDRGWFPDASRQDVLTALAKDDHGTVEGLARNVKLDPGQQTSTGDWTRLDPATMGKQLSYPVVAWQVTQGRRETIEDEQSAPTAYPVQLWTDEGPSIPHLDYALTWYGLAVALVVISIIRFRMQAKRAAGPPAAAPTAGPAV